MNREEQFSLDLVFEPVSSHLSNQEPYEQEKFQVKEFVFIVFIYTGHLSIFAYSSHVI